MHQGGCLSALLCRESWHVSCASEVTRDGPGVVAHQVCMIESRALHVVVARCMLAEKLQTDLQWCCQLARASLAGQRCLL